MLIRSVLKNEMKNNVGVIKLEWWTEDKTEVNETETENKDDYSLNIVAIIIWVSDSSNFFSKK